MEKLIEYWIDMIQKELGSFYDLDSVKNQIKHFNSVKILNYFEIDGTGVFAYVVTDDFRMGKTLCEIMLYIKPEHRGNLKLVKRYINQAEKIAIDNDCKCVKIGSNIGFKDSSFIKLLKRWGYQDDTVSKILGG